MLFENSPVTTIDDTPAGVKARTPGGTVTAARAVLAMGGALAGRGSPVRHKVTIASSHMVITEPVPDVLEKIGWAGAPAITDCRSLLNYMRTTPDGRIAFGWGGGRIAAGGRRGGSAEVDGDVVAQVAKNLTEYFPDLKGRKITHAWGGLLEQLARKFGDCANVSGLQGHAVKRHPAIGERGAFSDPLRGGAGSLARDNNITTQVW